jgi:hypothetical protein
VTNKASHTYALETYLGDLLRSLLLVVSAARVWQRSLSFFFFVLDLILAAFVISGR